MIQSSNTTLISVAQAKSRTAQFAHLFDLFDRVATRRTRSLTEAAGEVISADDIANVPAEFAPVLRNVSTILSLRTLQDKVYARRTQAASTTGAHHSMPVGTAPLTFTAENPTLRAGMVEEDPKSLIFPLGGRYPFTFKLMLHKLYDPDEWAEQVKNAVEMSKSQFKPLAERVQNLVRDATANINEGEEKIVSTRPVLGASAKLEPPSPTKHSDSTTVSSKPEISRVVKKRCVGRRKSANGPLSTSVWVYDAAISATEVTGPRSSLEITLFVPRDTGGVVEGRTRRQSLTVMDATQDVPKREFKIAVSLLQEDISESVPPQRSSAAPAQGIIKAESMKKTRLITSAFTFEQCKTATMKRPLCV